MITEVGSGVDILSIPAMYRTVGATVYSNASDVLKLNFAAPVASGTPGEGVAGAEAAHTKVTQKLEPVRYTQWMDVSKENLSVNSFISSLIEDQLAAIGAKISSDLFAAIVADAGTPLTGYAAADAAAAMGWDDLLKLKAALPNIALRTPGFVMGSDIYSKLEGTSKDSGSGRFIIDDMNGTIARRPAFDAESLVDGSDATKKEIIYGDWSRAYVAEFGGATEIITDPYTQAKEGEVVMTFCRLADVAYNPNAFKVIENANPA
jgi:HK97 family phage major capsid protein